MGGGNPLKQIVNTVTDVVTKPFREVARAVGADGVVDAVDSVRDTQRGVTVAIIDTTSGKAPTRKMTQWPEQRKPSRKRMPKPLAKRKEPKMQPMQKEKATECQPARHQRLSLQDGVD